MKNEHDIVAQVYAAKEDSYAADQLVCSYLPFIKAETAKFIKRVPEEGQDDELSVAMFAFHEAVLGYRRSRGSFMAYAARAIKNRLINYAKSERRHSGHISLDAEAGRGDDDRTLLDKLSGEKNEVEEFAAKTAAQGEIMHFAGELGSFDLSLTDIADNCPKQERTLAACYRALEYAKTRPELFDILQKTKKLPISQLAEGAKVERKTLERHRKYMVAIMLAYTNGFEIIRGHLSQIVPAEGGRTA